MENKNDLTKILKDCPLGTKLYSPLFGEVEFAGIIDTLPFPIQVEARDGYRYGFTIHGYYMKDFNDVEVLLFPSKDQRDWSKFEVPTKKVTVVTLHPFDKVLVRDYDNEEWLCALLANYDSNDYDTPFSVIGGTGLWYKQCIPYTAETAHLLGTTDSPSVEYEIEFAKTFKD